jgi:hypothetical protein
MVDVTHCWQLLQHADGRPLHNIMALRLLLKAVVLTL